MKSVNYYLEKAISNIEEDRAMTHTLLSGVMEYLETDESLHSVVGPVAAKYVETLQRSNEQIVKIATLLEKKEKKEEGLSEEAKEELYEIMQQGTG